MGENVQKKIKSSITGVLQYIETLYTVLGIDEKKPRLIRVNFIDSTFNRY